MYKRIVFVDFDGTITMQDTIGGSIRQFVPEDEFKYFGMKLIKGEMTLSHVIQYAFNKAPSSLLPQLLDFVDSVAIRPGFSEFLDEMQRREIPVVVISGGIRQFMDRKLKPFRDRILAVHAVDLDVSQPNMRLISQYDNGDELLAKTEVMKLYDYEYSIGIGDSIPDRRMALAVDTIFARDQLAQDLTSQGRPFLPYEDFFDVLKAFPG